jgi:hypothetical protein
LLRKRARDGYFIIYSNTPNFAALFEVLFFFFFSLDSPLWNGMQKWTVQKKAVRNNGVSTRDGDSQPSTTNIAAGLFASRAPSHHYPYF